MRHIAAVMISVVLLSASSVSVVHAESPIVKLHVRFSPDKPGAGTTIHLGLHIGTASGAIPPPVTSVNISLPPGMEGTPTLGQVVCKQNMLEAFGEEGCSPNALMGRGSAVVALAFGPSVVTDAAEVAIFMGPPIQQHTTMVFLATSKSPVAAELIFHGAILPDPASPKGGFLETTIPLIPSVPDAPDASVVSMESTLGPEEITYFKYSHGKKVSYRPEGLALPIKCPHAGYPFIATLGFADGEITTTRNVIPCHPHRSHRRRK